jgi:hypothetical protein
MFLKVSQEVQKRLQDFTTIHSMYETCLVMWATHEIHPETNQIFQFYISDWGIHFKKLPYALDYDLVYH